MSWSPRFSELIKLLPLTWFPNLVNLLPSEQLEISSRDRLGLQRAAEGDGVLWRSSGGTSAEPLPLHPFPAGWSQHHAAAPWGRGSGHGQQDRRAGYQVPPTMGFLGSGTGELTAGNSNPCQTPTSASGSHAGTWPPAGLRQRPMAQGTGWSPSPSPWHRALVGAPHHQHCPRVFWESHFLFFD